jgi:hypothetical protein
MMQQRANLLWVPVLLVAAWLLGVQAAPGQSKREIHVLWIGNSLTYYNDLPRMVAELARAGRQPTLVHQQETPGGCTLEKHWNDGKALNKLRSRKWDFVVLQEHSQMPLKDPAPMFEYAKRFAAEIKKQGGETLLYLPFPLAKAPENQGKLTTLHENLAAQIKARVVPVGPAWAQALATDKPPRLYHTDMVHPGKDGSYLAACVFYATIYGKSPEGLPGKIGGLSDKEAQRFQAIAWHVVRGAGLPDSTQPTAVDRGQRVFTCGHSFHVFVPGILADMAKGAGIKSHTMVGRSSIGGSRVIQHWNVAEEKNKAKEALRAGKVDVLTLSPIFLPDEGIERFAKLAREHNPKVRVTVQEFWLPFDRLDGHTTRPKTVDHDAPTVAFLKKEHEPYFQSMDEHVRDLNKKLGQEVVFVVPVGQAVIALREKILAGEAPGLKKQSDLFTDANGHAKPPLQALAAYCHFAVIYRRTPVGLPVPPVLAGSDDKERLNRLLQELAWDAVTHHALSGVKEVTKRVNLLSGGDLSRHWTTTGNWKLGSDGVVTLTPRPGEKGWQRYDAYLWLHKPYRDFEAEFEYQVEKGGNSGFYFHVGDKKDPVKTGIEVQIYDSASKKPGAKLTDHDSGGIIPGIPPTNNAAKPAGEWNRMKVTCKGNNVTVTLNGAVVNEAALDSRTIKDRPATGYLGFQDHGLPLALRNIFVQDR